MLLRYTMLMRVLPLYLGCQLLAAGPSEIKERAKEFFQQAAAADVRLTPGNRGLSYLSAHRGQSTLKVLDFESGSTYQAYVEGNPDVYDHYWVDRDTVLFFVQQRGTPIGAYTANYKLGGSAPSPFTRVYDTLPDQESVYLAKSGGYSEKFADLYRINAYTGLRDTIEANDGSVLAWLTDKDGVPRIRYTIDENERDRYDYRKEPGAPWTRLEIDGHPIGVLFLDDSDVFVIFVRRNDADTFAAYRFDANRNRYLDTLVEHEEYDVVYNEIILDPETEESLGFTYDLDRPQTYWFDARLAHVEGRLNALHPECFNKILGYGPERSFIVYRRSGDRCPDEWRRFYSDSGKDEPLLTALPELETDELSPTSPIDFKARDGARVHGYLTRAVGNADRPGKTVLLLHGGPRARDRWGWDPEAQFFSALGYNVLKVNYRGSEGYGLTFSPYSHFHSMRASVRDAIDAARWLIEKGIADPDRIAVYGSSFGGHVALRTAADAPELFSVAVGYAGVYDWPKHLDEEFEKFPVWSRLKLNTYYPGFREQREKWFDASVLPVADKISCPVLLFHGRSDETVSSVQSRRLHKALKKAGKDVSLKLLNFNNHGLALESNRIRFYSELANFLEDNL